MGFLRTVLIFAILLGSSLLTGQEKGAKLGIWNPEVEASWWEENTEPEQWFELVDAMSITLREAHTRHGLEKMIRNPHWIGWMLHTRWLSLFPRDWESRPVFQEREGRDIFVRIGRNPKLRNAFLTALVPEDDTNEAATILCRIARAHPDAMRDYGNLSIAFAIVFDQPIPESWPHPFVDGKKIPVGDSAPEDRFAFYVAAQEAGGLVHDLRRLDVQDLTFLVDSPLEFKELRYAQQIRINTPNRLAQLYPQVPYDNSRISRREYQWRRPTYRLIDIGTKGGICMDQAFFVAQTGKAKGIPTLLFTGQGLSGDHGWVGYLGNDGRWNMDVAKSGREKYPIGQAFDPQTWQRITDSELVALMRGSRFSGKFDIGPHLLQWAALNHGNELYHEVIRAARVALGKDPRPWQLEADWIEESDASLETQLQFWHDWSKNYSDNPDMEVKGQIRVIAILEEMDRESDAERVRESVMSGNRSKRFDLGIAVAADPVFRGLQRKDYEGARKAFENAMARFRSKAGGHLFYNLIQPYTLTCLEDGRKDLAADALKQIERGFQVQPGSMLDLDMKTLQRRVEGNQGSP